MIPNDSSHDGSLREVRSWSEAIKDPPGSSSVEAFYYRYSEFRLALTDKPLEVQLAEIKMPNERMQRLAVRAVRLSRKNLGDSQLRTLETVRDYASIVSRALRIQSGISCRC